VPDALESGFFVLIRGASGLDNLTGIMQHADSLAQTTYDWAQSCKNIAKRIVEEMVFRVFFWSVL
jgi:hypothetical protein